MAPEDVSSRINGGNDVRLSHETLSHGNENSPKKDTAEKPDTRKDNPSTFTVNNIAKGENLNLMSDSDIPAEDGVDSDYPNEEDDEEMKITTSKPLRGRPGGHRDLSR